VNSILQALGVNQAVQNLENQAQSQAQQLWNKAQPYVWAATFMAVTAYLFFFVPRMVLPWHDPD